MDRHDTVYFRTVSSAIGISMGRSSKGNTGMNDGNTATSVFMQAVPPPIVRHKFANNHTKLATAQTGYKSHFDIC